MVTEDAAQSGRFSPGNWLIALLFSLCYILSYADRQVLSILIEPLKASLHLSDTQIGLMQGVSFSLFYVAASLPLAWAADRFSRVRVISACVAAWSLFSIGCGFASNFAQMLLLRIGVAATESGLTPAALAILSQRFDPKRLSIATGMFMLAPFIGGGLAISGGGILLKAMERLHAHDSGLLAQIAPWRTVFMVVGAPGLILALLVLLIPERRTREKRAPAQDQTLGALVSYLLKEWRIFVLYGLAMGLTMTVLSSYITWLPAALMRAEHVDEQRIAVTFGPIYLIAGATGTILASVFVITRKSSDPVRAILTTMIGVNFLLWPFAAFGLLLPGLGLKLAAMGVTIFLISCVTSLSSLPFQHLTPHKMRSQALALLAMASALFGTGLGPVLGGVMSDLFTFAAQPLSLALCIIGGVALPVAQIFLMVVLGQHMRTRLDQGLAHAATLPPQ